MGFLAFVIVMAAISIASTTKESRAAARNQPWAIRTRRVIYSIGGAIVLSFFIMG